MLHKFKKIIAVGLMIVGVLAIISFGFIFYWATQTDYKFTGQELFDEINKYRASKNLSQLTIDPVLCDNLVERYLAIKEPNSGHKGFEDWLKSEGIKIDVNDNSKYRLVGEMYIIDASTPSNAINWWINSPGHKSTLELPIFNKGCAYASNGTAVVIMAESNPDMK
jgi:hypothetical protein